MSKPNFNAKLWCLQLPASCLRVPWLKWWRLNPTRAACCKSPALKRWPVDCWEDPFRESVRQKINFIILLRHNLGVLLLPLTMLTFLLISQGNSEENCCPSVHLNIVTPNHASRPLILYQHVLPGGGKGQFHLILPCIKHQKNVNFLKFELLGTCILKYSVRWNGKHA